MTAAKSPSHLKLAGTERADRPRAEKAKLPGDVVTEVPKLPSWLKNEFAIEEWNRVAPIVVGAGTLTEGRVTLLAQMCAVHGQIASAYCAGSLPPANVLSTFRMMLVDLGISESQANRTEEKGGNKFARNGRRPGK